MVYLLCPYPKNIIRIILQFNIIFTIYLKYEIMCSYCESGGHNTLLCNSFNRIKFLANRAHPASTKPTLWYSSPQLLRLLLSWSRLLKLQRARSLWHFNRPVAGNHRPDCRPTCCCHQWIPSIRYFPRPHEDILDHPCLQESWPW